jgi:hypothetical protein
MFPLSRAIAAYRLGDVAQHRAQRLRLMPTHPYLALQR